MASTVPLKSGFFSLKSEAIAINAIKLTDGFSFLIAAIAASVLPL